MIHFSIYHHTVGLISQAYHHFSYRAQDLANFFQTKYLKPVIELQHMTINDHNQDSSFPFSLCTFRGLCCMNGCTGWSYGPFTRLEMERVCRAKKYNQCCKRNDADCWANSWRDQFSSAKKWNSRSLSVLIPLIWEAGVSVISTKQLSQVREGEIYFRQSKDNVRKGAVGCKLALWEAAEKETFLGAEEGPKIGKRVWGRCLCIG